MISRMQFPALTPLLVTGLLTLSGCLQEPATGGHEEVAERTWQPGPARNLSGVVLGREPVRCANLASSSLDAVGRCPERFALQATSQGIRNAFLNQPVEVAASRPPFANALGPSCQRLFLLLWFGRSPVLPRSLRRPAEAVLASDEAAWARPEGRKVHFVGHVKKLNHKFML